MHVERYSCVCHVMDWSTCVPNTLHRVNVQLYSASGRAYGAYSASITAPPSSVEHAALATHSTRSCVVVRRLVWSNMINMISWRQSQMYRQVYRQGVWCPSKTRLLTRVEPKCQQAEVTWCKYTQSSGGRPCSETGFSTYSNHGWQAAQEVVPRDLRRTTIAS